MLKIAFAGQADHAREPVRVLTGLNRSLCDKFDAHFVTAAYLYVDLEKRLLHYAAAAHPPLLLISGAAHKVSEIEENGLALGIFPESVYSSVEIRVCPGDRCLLYTDGILEPRTLPRNSSASHVQKSSGNATRNSGRAFRQHSPRQRRPFCGPSRAGRRHYPPRAGFSKGAQVSRKLCRRQQISRSDLAAYKLVSRS
jgi:hypothetical protein